MLPGTWTPSPVSGKLKDRAVDPKRQPHIRQASLVAQILKNPPASVGDDRELGLISGGEDPLEEEVAAHSSILAWRIAWTEESGGLWSTGWQRVGHTLAQNT